MKEGDYANVPDFPQMTGSSTSEQTVESENSSGSIFQATTVDGEHVTNQQPSSAVSESDSGEHFSDAVQDTDDESIYITNDDVTQRDIGITPHTSQNHLWSASPSGISILLNDTAPTTWSSRIPVSKQSVPQVGRSSSCSSFHFSQVVANCQDSRIPIPVRFAESAPFELNRYENESNDPRRAISVDKEIPDAQEYLVVEPPKEFPIEDVVSSESENITAINIKEKEQHDEHLERIKSEDICESVSLPLDNFSTIPLTVLPCIEASSNPEIGVLQNSQETEVVSSYTAANNPYESEGEETEDLHSFDTTAETVNLDEDLEKEHSETEKIDGESLKCNIDDVAAAEIVKLIKLETLQQEITLPPPDLNYLRVDHKYVDMGQIQIREVVPALVVPISESQISGGRDEKYEESDPKETILCEQSEVLKNEYSQDEYCTEIDEEPVKKQTKFSKLKNKLRGRSSNKDIKKKGSSMVTTLKVRRKPPQTPGSRPSSAKRTSALANKASVPLRPRATSAGIQYSTDLKASIKQNVEKMRLRSDKPEKDVTIEERSSSDTTLYNFGNRDDGQPDQKESDSQEPSSGAIKTIFRDPALRSSKEVPKSSALSSKKPNNTKDEETPPNPNKLNQLTSRYRLQRRKFKTQLADLEEIQTKTGNFYETLSSLKTQIIALSGGTFPSDLSDIPLIPGITTSESESKEEIEELLAERADLRSENCRLQNCENVLNRDNFKLRDELSNVNSQLTAMRKQISESRQLNDERSQAIEALKIESQKLKRINETLRRKNDDHLKNANELKVKAEEEKSRKVETQKAMAAEITSLKAKLQLETSKKDCSQQALSKLKEEQGNLESQLKLSQQTIERLQEQIQGQAETIKAAREMFERNEMLEKKIDKLEQNLQESKKYSESLASKIDCSEEIEKQTSQRLIELSEELLEKMKLIEQLTEQKQFEHCRRQDLYKTISKFSKFSGYEVDYVDLAVEAEQRHVEESPLMLKIYSEFEKNMKMKNAEIEKLKQNVTDLQTLDKEKQTLIEQLYEFVNDKNASIYQRSESRNVDNRDEEKSGERSPNTGIEIPSKSHPNFQELYSMLYAKRHKLLRMESQIRQLQDVHSYCGFRRTTQESRIAELETMLAHCLH